MQALEQNTQEWLDFRKDKIGASDMPIILGLSPYCTPYELWRRKIGFATEKKETEVMQKGKELEPYVRSYINENTEYYFTPEVVASPHFEWAIASLDGIDKNRKVGLEVKSAIPAEKFLRGEESRLVRKDSSDSDESASIGSLSDASGETPSGTTKVKSTSQKNHKLVENNTCPEIFYPQIQWQMFCGDLEYVILAHMSVENIVYTTVRRNDSYIESTLIPVAKEFHKCLIEFIPPEATESDYMQIVDEGFDKIACEWMDVHLEIKNLKKKEEELKKQLIEYTDDGNCRGYGLLIKKKTRKGSVDWNTLWEKACQKFPIQEEFNPESFRKEDVWYWDVRIEKG